MTEIKHRQSCPKSATPQRITGQSGHEIERCGQCGRYRTLTDEELAPAAPRVPLSGYVCREHTDQAVNWRGKGCAMCKREREKGVPPVHNPHIEGWGGPLPERGSQTAGGLSDVRPSEPSRFLRGSR